MLVWPKDEGLNFFTFPEKLTSLFLTAHLISYLFFMFFFCLKENLSLSLRIISLTLSHDSDKYLSDIDHK